MTESDPAAGLPERPDSETGLPRPPRAPLFIGQDRPAAENRNRDSRESRKPSPPPGQGPVLAWYRASIRGAVALGVTGTLLIVAVLFVIKGFNVQLLETWWIWLIAAAAGFGIFLSTKVDWCAIGADWLLHRKAWVKIYELTEIRTRFISNDINLRLTDKDGRIVDTTFMLLQHDRRVWDYLYLGIRHSIANGAELRGTARRYFTVQKSHGLAETEIPPAEG